MLCGLKAFYLFFFYQTLQQTSLLPNDYHHEYKYLRLISFLTLSNNPLTYFTDSMSHTRQSQSALAAKVETLLKLAYLKSNRTPTLTYFVIPLFYLLSHSASILPFPMSLSVSILFFAVSSPRSAI